MAKEDDHVTTLREAYRRWHDSKGGSVQHWLGLMTDDVCFRSLTGGTREGAAVMGFERDNNCRGAVETYFAQMAAEWEMVRFVPERFVAQGDRVAVLGECAWRSKRSGKVAESPFAQFFTFRDDRIAEVVEMFDSATAAAVHVAPPA